MKKPGKLKKLSNFTLAAAKFAAGGFIKSSKEVYSSRVLTCLACDKYEVQTDDCLECGCPIELKAKWSTELCPLNKWTK
jgi:hypothetical protein